MPNTAHGMKVGHSRIGGRKGFKGNRFSDNLGNMVISRPVMIRITARNCGNVKYIVSVL